MPDFELSPPSQHAAALQTSPDYGDAENDDHDDGGVEPPSRIREGLPPAYRMRHAPHYVEQLMGEAPIQTVRQIALDQIDTGASQSTGDVTGLAASIGQVGVLQPLLVTQGSSGRFELLAGVKRLHAARSAGLSVAPCLVVHADEARAAELRAQAAVTADSSGNAMRPRAAGTDADPGPAHVGVGPDVEGRSADRADTPLTAVLDEITGALEFVSALLPAASVARSAFQRAMIADVVRVEKGRAAALKAAAFFLSDVAPLQPETFDWTEITEDLRTDAALEGRLRGVEIEWLHTLTPRDAVADKKAVMTAWTAILHAVLEVSQPGDRIAISVATPRTRPAIVFTVTLHPDARQAGEADSPALAGDPSDLMLRCARRAAERHGGQLTVTTTSSSLVIEFAAPQPLSLRE